MVASRNCNSRTRRLALLAALSMSVAGCFVEAKPVQQRKVAKTDTAVAVAAPDTLPSFQIDSTPPEHYADVTGSGRYIDSIFRAQTGEAPRIGWFVGNTFLAGEKHARVWVLSSDSAIIEGRLQRIASDAEHRKFTDKDKVACDIDGGLAIFTIDHAPLSGEYRAYFMSSPIPRPYQVGVQRRPANEAELAASRAAMGSVKPDAGFLDATLSVRGSEARYTLLAAYDAANHELLATVIVLMSGDKVVGFDRNIANDYECDGCATPTFEDGLSRLYPVMNGYTFAGFAYPVLLLNTSTNEGQARSLVTFNRSGKYGEYRSYEYIVSCGRT